MGTSVHPKFENIMLGFVISTDFIFWKIDDFK